MSKDQIIERLTQLRNMMKQEGIDYFMIPTGDYHGSEYVSDYFKVREFYSGFTGSNGTLLVWMDGAGLWTDGRYFIQADKELSGTGIDLFRMGDEGVPTIKEYLCEHIKENGKLAMDGRVVSAREGKELEKVLHKKHAELIYDKDPADVCWQDRPKFPQGAVIQIPDVKAGKNVQQKLAALRKAIKEKGADAIFISKLDDIMWLYNIRGCDVECNPVAMSYTYVSEEEAILFIGEGTVSDEILKCLADANVRIESYDKAQEIVLSKLTAKTSLMLDTDYVHYRYYKEFSKVSDLIEEKNPTELFKAQKNPVELSNMERIYLIDSVAVTKFIYWLKHNIGKRKITELDAAEYLDNLRRAVPEFLDLSFPTISAYGANAAMMHYEATKKDFAELLPKGLYLVDSGGQYMGGTTDVTRTIALGEVSPEIKKHYSLVAAGMWHMTQAKWLYGCTGRNLDILARRRLWEIGLDYKCGTGHGVGYILNVHEGPHALRWKYNPNAQEAVFEEGMDVTNEPGVYVEGSHGIRIENVMVVKKGLHNEYGQFMHFDTLTWVPLDPEAMDITCLTAEELEGLRKYQQNVFYKLAPYLTEEERAWLKEERF